MGGIALHKKIIFTSILDFDDLEKPKPASTIIPDWYKNTKSYVFDKKIPTNEGTSSGTIKKCIPVFDAITAGYIITSPTDIYVGTNENSGQFFYWPNFGAIEFHPIEQAQEHPLKKPFNYPKWMNPWAIKTEKGYSVLITQPMHRDLPFTIFPGVVDTDTYTAPINFPFVINDPLFEGLIPRGTPIAQIIPFKRDSWEMSIGDEKEKRDQFQITLKLTTKLFDKYKNMFWDKKQYK
jgi:hypothetical protein